MMQRLEPHKAALGFADAHYPAAGVVFLGGSAATGKATPTSDLDVLVIDDAQREPFRKSCEHAGWPVEAFVLTGGAVGDYFDLCAVTGMPTLLRLCACGLVLRDDGSAGAIVEDARLRLAAGPDVWTEAESRKCRYEITEYLDDLAGCGDRSERLFVVSRLIGHVPQFALRSHGRWVGDGKWMIRDLMRFDAGFARELVDALERFYREDRIDTLMSTVDRLLAPHGGRLFAGYAEGSGHF